MKRTILEQEELQEQFLEAISNGETNQVKQLIENGADINGCNFYGQTPLHIAAKRGNKECIDILIAAKADPNIIDFERLTPLYVAVSDRHHKCIQSLIDAGAKMNA